ncbi:MAG TPA: hypothetical protein VG520_05740 [Candidatus Dormibacteraeota bacterium]|nr:hypothetical protein [Candidatus Dormibacteraeota bacterium]
MPRPLIIAAIALALAVLAAAVAAVLPSELQRASLGLFAFAAAASLGVAVLLLVDGAKRRAAHRADLAAAESPLRRLEHLPSVTTGTRLIRWRGGRHLVGRRLAAQAPAAGADVALVGVAQAGGGAEQLTGSGYRRPASSTRQPLSDAAEAAPRRS